MFDRFFYRSADADIEILLTGSWLVGLPRLRLPQSQGRSRACQFHWPPFENTPQSRGRSGTSGSAHTGSEIIKFITSIWNPTWKKLSRAALLSSTLGMCITWDLLISPADLTGCSMTVGQPDAHSGWCMTALYCNSSCSGCCCSSLLLHGSWR